MSVAPNINPQVITSLYACSDVGNVRNNNEDNFVISDLITGRCCTAPQSIARPLAKNRLLIAVADGMGGAQAGEVASALAVYGLRLELLKQTLNGENLEVVDRLIYALEKINKLIWQESQRNLAFKGMGAAITAVIVEGERAYIAEVGDSRAYLVRKGRIKQITTDQSLYEALKVSGVYRGDASEQPPSRNIILQSLGGQEEVQVAVNSVQLQAGDYLLLCSDGLSNKLSAEEIRKFIARAPNLESACTTMISVAKKRGGDDNITVVLCKFEGDALRASEQGSITKSIDVIAAFDPLTGEVDRRTRQMVSDKHKKVDENQIFRSTIGIVPAEEYPNRAEILAASEQAVCALDESGKQMAKVVAQVKLLQDWLQRIGRDEPSVQKALAHLEHAIKNIEKIENVARKARNVIDRVTAKPE